jgi:hypothetical protein
MAMTIIFLGFLIMVAVLFVAEPILGTFFGLLLLAAFIYAQRALRGFEKHMLTAADVFAEQMGGVSALPKQLENERKWFYGTHKGHDFGFEVVLLRMPNNFDGSLTPPRPMLRLVVGVDCQEPLGVTGNRPTPTSPFVRVLARGIEAKIRGIPTVLTVARQMVMPEEQANKLSAATKKKMIAFLLEHLSLRIRDRHAVPPMYSLPPGLLQTKHVVLGYEKRGIGGRWFPAERKAFEFDHGEVHRALDDLVGIAEELEQANGSGHHQPGQ